LIEIVPARAGGPHLDPILQDYRRRYQLSETTILNALLEALTTRHAQALLALLAGRPVGAVIISQREGEGRLRLLHTLATAPTAAATLLARADEILLQSGAQHVTGSLPLAPQDPLLEALRQSGYQVIPRARMVLDFPRTGLSLELSPDYRLLPWHERYQDAAAVLLETAHRDSADIAMHPEFAGPEGTQRLFQTIFAGRYGRFDPDHAWLVLAGEQLAGVALNVWHAALLKEGFILDLAVAAAHRRHGLGRALVAATARSFQEAGAPRLGLAVTLANRPAVGLYEGLGFQVEQYFTVVSKSLP
jgi:ribosomal protein S18 acetylase RimI-like enzyme